MGLRAINTYPRKPNAQFYHSSRLQRPEITNLCYTTHILIRRPYLPNPGSKIPEYQFSNGKSATN